MKSGWVWNLLKILAVLVIFLHLYFEVALAFKVFIEPPLKTSSDLVFREGLGILAPLFYLIEGGIKILEGLSPFIDFIWKILFAINSFLLIISIIVTRFVFKNKNWAGVIIVLFLFPPWILGLGP